MGAAGAARHLGGRPRAELTREAEGGGTGMRYMHMRGVGMRVAPLTTSANRCRAC